MFGVKKTISIIVPVHNEEKNVHPFFDECKKAVAALPYRFEYIFVDDGSSDNSAQELAALAKAHSEVSVIELSRNFGKEAATTAGIHHARGDALICIDADLQHPPQLIGDFIKKWEQGAEVVLGIRTESKSDFWFRRFGSRMFYRIMNRISETKLIPHETDFRLIDRQVAEAFGELSEHNRMTRSLIDWLGFRRDYIYFEARERLRGTPSYSTFKLVQLAVSSFISHSLLPLRLAGYVGVATTLLAGALGLIMLLDRYVFDWGLHFSGSAMLADLILFLVGVMLSCVGLLAFYIGHIHTETQNRPLYVVRKTK